MHYENNFKRPPVKISDHTLDMCIWSHQGEEGALGGWLIPLGGLEHLSNTYLVVSAGRGTWAGNDDYHIMIMPANRWERDAADISWATKALELQEKPSHSDLVGIVNGISRLIAERKTGVLETTLGRLLGDDRLRLDVMIAALRGSFPAKSQIPKWMELVAIAHQRIVGFGRNPESLLRGL